ncbi:thiopeptide-type bacteriocin biosynthesis protein [Nocardioides plantarum]|uniref:Thiopeptide-type bacteriocin biosynthesis protein n=1 Tax=Nocardioides plantarum TaxID=29299 RepID=A0ABV5K4T7_9ACTN|nr:thiopeptide-type bacteriocin biosynthesis protein [Nocardioides plantarum]
MTTTHHSDPSPAPYVGAWAAWHLHLGTAATSAGDRVLRETIEPAVVALGRPWFFIRYWQGGPHLRLRVAGLTAPEVATTTARLEESLRSSGTLRDGEAPLDAAAFSAEAARHAAAETGSDRVAGDVLAPGVHPSTYEPELQRYGGPALMVANEELFELSSQMVAAVLRSSPSRGQRAAAALRATVAAATTLGDAADHAVFYGIGQGAWRRWAEQFGYPAEVVGAASSVTPEALGGVPVHPRDHGPFAPWHEAVAGLVDDVLTTAPERHPGEIVSSQVHMTHNRLGLGILDELRTYALLARAFPSSVATG